MFYCPDCGGEVKFVHGHVRFTRSRLVEDTFLVCELCAFVSQVGSGQELVDHPRDWRVEDLREVPEAHFYIEHGQTVHMHGTTIPTLRGRKDS